MPPSEYRRQDLTTIARIRLTGADQVRLECARTDCKWSTIPMVGGDYGGGTIGRYLEHLDTMHHDGPLWDARKLDQAEREHRQLEAWMSLPPLPTETVRRLESRYGVGTQMFYRAYSQEILLQPKREAFMAKRFQDIEP